MLMPPVCLMCDGPGLPGPIDLCIHCLEALPRAAGPGAPPVGFDFLCCPWRYEFPVDALVQALKFHGDRAPARVFGTLLARERGQRERPLPSRVIPVPLHPLRLRQRGYNQAAEIARHAARELGLRCERGALRRAHATREQTGLGSRERVRNVRGAFAASRPCPGLRVALVDDVITTGSTAAAAAAALRAAGAEAVELWVVAQAVRRSAAVEPA